MLTDTKIKTLKPKDKIYKVTDRDGLYVSVSTKGTISFRYDYRINGRRETLTIGRYGADGISLAEAREKLIEAKKLVSQGVSAASAKREEKKKIKGDFTFEDFANKWTEVREFARTTQTMISWALNKEILPAFGNKLLSEITSASVLALCEKIKNRGSPAAAIKVRNIISSIFKFAISTGIDIKDPTYFISASAIATTKPRDRSLSADEIGVLFTYLDRVSAMATVRVAIKIILLTMVRKSELLNATWDEVDLDNETWTISADRMKSRRAHVVYMSKQVVELFSLLKALSAGSPFVIPSISLSQQKPMSHGTLNRAIDSAVKLAQEAGERIDKVSVHDLRRTASTILHETGFNSDWIEKCLAHEQKGVRAVYNKAEYAAQRKDMLQQWADMVDVYINAGNC